MTPSTRCKTWALTRSASILMLTMNPTDDSRDLWLAYAHLAFLTPARLRVLLERFGTPAAIRSASVAELSALLRLPEDRATLVKDPLQDAEISRAVTRARQGAITPDDEEYPPRLRQIPDPPAALFHSGQIAIASNDCVGIVGSRQASRYGLAVAERLAFQLSNLGITVVSGLARGIDQAAHAGAMRGRGSTVAVLGAGLDADYPRRSGRLRAQIETEGLVLSEWPPATPPRPENFPIRNRVISGLSLGVVIVEATDRSGSLITARLAAEQDREVFAVPGSVFHQGSLGPHRLIQYGAKLVVDVDDILEEIRLSVVHRKDQATAPAASLPGLAGRIIATLSVDEPTHTDALAASLEAAPGELSRSLLELEIEGRIRSVPGGGWVRAPV